LARAEKGPEDIFDKFCERAAMSQNIQNILPYLSAGLLALALLLGAVSLRLFRRSRSDVFWRRRRDAGQRGWRTFVLAAALIVLSGLMCLITALSSVMDEDESDPTRTENVAGPSSPFALSPTFDQAAAPVMTTLPVSATLPDTPATIVIVVTATPAYTPTETIFPTFTPLMTPLVSDVTPLPDATIKITALDDQISDVLRPVDPRSTFAAGVTRIYLFVAFENMTQGMLWRRELYRDGEKIDGNSYLWGLETAGTGYFFFGSDSGFPPGAYGIRLYIGDEVYPISSMSFTVLDAP
jgi:hypothetical protein